MGKSGELGPEGEPGIKVPLYIRSLLFKYIKMCLFNNCKCHALFSKVCIKSYGQNYFSYNRKLHSCTWTKKQQQLK